MGKKFKHETDIYGYCVLRNEELQMQSTNPHWNSWKTMDSRFMARMHWIFMQEQAARLTMRTIELNSLKNLVIDSIEACPEEFTLCGRDPKN